MSPYRAPDARPAPTPARGKLAYLGELATAPGALDEIPP
jgi:hypothetical protein